MQKLQYSLFEDQPTLYAENIIIEGEKVLHLKIWTDFYEIKEDLEYYEFPLDIHSNNHFFLGEEHIHYLLLYLKDFINGQEISSHIHIPPGFHPNNFQDLFGNKIQIFNSEAEDSVAYFGYQFNGILEHYSEHTTKKTIFQLPSKHKNFKILDTIRLDIHHAKKTLHFLEKIWNESI